MAATQAEWNEMKQISLVWYDWAEISENLGPQRDRWISLDCSGYSELTSRRPSRVGVVKAQWALREKSFEK